MEQFDQYKELPGDKMIALMRAAFEHGAAFQFCARGESMSPFIRSGDTVTILPKIRKRLGIGRIVAFTHPDNGKLIIHRIVGRQGGYYLIRGDSVFASSIETVPVHNIIGYVSNVERKGKRVLLGIGLEGFIIALLSRNEFIRWWRYKLK